MTNREMLRVDLARIAAAPDSPQDRAAEILHVLGRAMRYDAAWLAVRDPERRRHTPLATAGHAAPLHRYFQTPEADDDLDQLGLNRYRPPMMAAELPNLAEVRAWGEYLLPAGFRDGVAVGLFTSDGRHLGFLSLLSMDSVSGRFDGDAIADVTTLIADGIDRARDLASAARLVHGATAGILLTHGGALAGLPGLPGHRLLTPQSRVVAAAVRELDGDATYSTFLAPATATRALVRVTALACDGDDHLHAVVLLSPPGNQRGLTYRQLRVLGLLAEGITRPAELAAALGARGSSVAHALDVVRVLLDSPDLPAAAARAISTGLRIPPDVAAQAGASGMRGRNAGG